MDPVLMTLCDEVALQHPLGGPLRELLALREGDPFATHALARIVGRQRGFLEGVRAGHRYVAEHASEAGSPLMRRRSIRAFAEGSDAPAAVEPGLPSAESPRRPPAFRSTATPREVIEFNGYRLTHAMTVSCEVVALLGREFQAAELGPAWRWTFVTATYTMVLGGVLGRQQDDAFAAAFLTGACGLLFDRYAGGAAAAARQRAGTTGVTLAEAQVTEVGCSSLDLARRLAVCWDLPLPLLAAFEPHAPADSLSDLVQRAGQAAARHGFVDPLGVPDSPGLFPEREPILDAYLGKSGGLAGVARGAGAMMAIALIRSE